MNLLIWWKNDQQEFFLDAGAKPRVSISYTPYYSIAPNVFGGARGGLRVIY